MKMRYGFVSNSSSSSFIINNASVEDIATRMLNVVIQEFEDWDNVTDEEKALHVTWKKNLLNAFKNDSVKNGDIGITMPSCNYNTYIAKKGDDVYISTSGNHYWGDISNDASYFGGGEDDGAADDTYEVINNSNYFNIENNKIHSVEQYDENEGKCPECKKSLGYFVIEDGKKICSYCYKGKIQ